MQLNTCWDVKHITGNTHQDNEETIKGSSFLGGEVIKIFSGIGLKNLTIPLFLRLDLPFSQR